MLKAQMNRPIVTKKLPAVSTLAYQEQVVFTAVLSY